MPRGKRFLAPKPGKDELLIKRGSQSNPASIKEATKGMSPGDQRGGSLGKGDTRKPDFVPEKETLDVDGIARKGSIKNLLIKVIQPVSLGSKSTSEMDRRSLVNKVNRMTLDELRRFLPERVDTLTTEQLQQIASGETAIYEEEEAEIQDLYMNISP